MPQRDMYNGNSTQGAATLVSDSQRCFSSRTERLLYGRRLYYEVEEQLARYRVEVLVTYPVDASAMQFWRALGFLPAKHGISLLPPEELIPCSQGGRLLPFINAGSGIKLERWEKAIKPRYPLQEEDEEEYEEEEEVPME
eukprot:CAMPEP_0170623680 /NCGR_PEP_ID=MMETSP0224-20130122/29828_1 /TAXON_ID=285029 /ORGANISM="Togula jolla, Strain CCCM 725" /LENGTH=139 /DNA_ID=CAMNT_0010950151 /DNA_START=379 /DNA_END=798 /DNA_ORIENTATION=-